MKQQIISFKSTDNFFHKEKIGWKKNTCRKVEVTDSRYDKLYMMMKEGPQKNDYIEIVLVNNPNIKFKRKIQDVSFWEGIFIISW